MRSNRCSSSVGIYLFLGFFAALGLAFSGCGGSGGGGTPPPAAVPTASIQGSVSGTIILAIDETGKIAAKDDTAGKTALPGSSPPKYPFTLTVPSGHQYTIQFIVNEGKPGEKMVPLYEGTTNIFSVSSTGKLDLGYVDTSGATAVADNNILTQPGVTSGGTTPPPTIKLEGYRYLNTRNESNGAVTARFHVEVRDPSGTTPVTDKALIRGVAFFDNDWNALPLSGSFALWNGTNLFQNDASGSIVPTPRADVEAFLAPAPSGMAAGFYNVVVTDNAGNLHKAQVYFRQPDTVAKPSNLAQAINADNSITLTWTNPTFPTGPQYDLRLVVQSDDLDGDTINDWQLMIVDRIPPLRSSYTIPESFVAGNLAGKSGLKWHVQIRQYDNTIVFPDGTSQGNNTQFYRNYSAEKTLTLPAVPVVFSQADLAGVWDLVQLVNGTQHRWDRATATVDASGNITVSSLESSVVPPPPPPTTFQWYIDSAGVVSEWGDGILSPFRGNMSSDKKLVVGSQPVGGSASLIRVARKRGGGVTYSSADIYNKSFVVHTLGAGDLVGWSYGTGTIDGTGQIRITSAVDDVGTIPVDPDLVVGQFAIDGNGIVSESDPTFKGFLTPDKTTMFLVNTSLETTYTSQQLIVISLVNPAKTFIQSDLSGTSRFHALWEGTSIGWAYGTAVIGATGATSVSGTTSLGPLSAADTLTLGSNGTITATNPTFHGTLSSNNALAISTATNQYFAGEFSLMIGVK